MTERHPAPRDLHRNTVAERHLVAGAPTEQEGAADCSAGAALAIGRSTGPGRPEED